MTKFASTLRFIRSWAPMLLAAAFIAVSADTASASGQRHGGGQRSERNEGRRNNGGSRHESNRNDRRQESRRGNAGRGNADRGNGGRKDPVQATRPVNSQYRPGAAGNHANQNNNGGNHNNGGNNGGNHKPDNGYKPGNNGGNHNNNGYQPGNNGNHNRPGNNGNHNRPGNNGYMPGGNHNGNNGNHGYKPGGNHGGNHGGGHNWTPGRPNHVRPGMAIHRPPMAPPPMRPHRPVHFYGFGRPTPPPRSWRPGPRPLFSTVLGLTFGSAITAGIDALISAGYTVDGYTNNMVYVNDAVQLNFVWPYGALQYNSRGLLEASEFVYDSPYRDMGRYNAAYNRLCSLYGPPVDFSSAGVDRYATWWGPGGQYVSLRFSYGAPMSGPYRYYTTLSFGI